MGRRKANLCTRSKSVTLEKASSQDVDEVGDQEMHEASTQDVQPAVRVTRGSSKYLEIWDLLDEEEIELPLNSMHQPVDDGARTFTSFLGTIAWKPHMCLIRYLNWKDMSEELKEECWRVVEDKMKELLVEPSNQLQSSNISGSIAWSIDDVFAKVMGKEDRGRIRGVGFGPSPSGRSSKSALTNIEIHSSQARDNEVAQLKASLATMEEKLASFDEMKERPSQFEEMEQRMARMVQQMQQISF
ncbi:hypothetical protein SO802_005902 [Lithocarpus litseifolius]|uniref:Uncharacterized protein n=1 Tax=Lithocarpus litseifolius TaxID=425828 RepID=A0AAW2DMP4_9ROSI